MPDRDLDVYMDVRQRLPGRPRLHAAVLVHAQDDRAPPPARRAALPSRVVARQRAGPRLDRGHLPGLAEDESHHIVDAVLAAVPGALELARQDVADVPGGLTVADTIIANLRAISPLYPRDAAILLTDGPMSQPAPSAELAD